jgi:Na+-transporting NADH:ubiquinone oxidoreductase subunit NqrC
MSPRCCNKNILICILSIGIIVLSIWSKINISNLSNQNEKLREFDENEHLYNNHVVNTEIFLENIKDNFNAFIENTKVNFKKLKFPSGHRPPVIYLQQPHFF